MVTAIRPRFFAFRTNNCEALIRSRLLRRDDHDSKLKAFATRASILASAATVTRSK